MYQNKKTKQFESKPTRIDVIGKRAPAHKIGYVEFDLKNMVHRNHRDFKRSCIMDLEGCDNVSCRLLFTIYSRSMDKFNGHIHTSGARKAA